MKHCNKCGAKVSADSKFCQDCGSSLIIDGSNSPINANLKVSLTNETTEKMLSGVSGGISSIVTTLINFIRKIIKPVIIIAIFGVIVAGIGAFLYESQREEERKNEEAEERKKMTFETQKAFGTFQIKGMTKNGKYISYFSTGTVRYSDDNEYDSWLRPTGRVTITEDKMVVHIDWNRDNHLSNKEKKIFKIKSISKSSNPDDYSYGLFETDIDENVNFIITSVYYSNSYRLLYKIGEDHYQLWLK